MTIKKNSKNMTREEKAKAYDEALRMARKQRDDYQKELNKTDKNSQLAGLLRAGISALEMAFPELRESEDDKVLRIIKRQMTYGSAPASEEERKLVDAWLEKQKESLHITETCKENGNSFTNEDERVRKELLALFESIQGEYWHELRVSSITSWLIRQGVDEKVMKGEDDEKIRRILIRVVEDAWDGRLTAEISDDRIYNGCLAWLEKQKEEEGYEAIPVESTLEYKLGFKAGKESEKQKDIDKMIVVSPEVWDTAISDAFENGKKEGEKQKEQKVDTDKLRKDIYQSGYNDGYQHGKEDTQKEQKPAEVKDPFSNANFVRGYESGYNDAIREQKPAEWSEEDEDKRFQIIDIHDNPE